MVKLINYRPNYRKLRKVKLIHNVETTPPPSWYGLLSREPELQQQQQRHQIRDDAAGGAMRGKERIEKVSIRMAISAAVVHFHERLIRLGRKFRVIFVCGQSVKQFDDFDKQFLRLVRLVTTGAGKVLEPREFGLQEAIEIT